MNEKIRCPHCKNTEEFYYGKGGYMYCLRCGRKIPNERLEGYMRWWEKIFILLRRRREKDGLQ